jgi:ElaB/YqjD/DUF883 family membrane-anchored ribosome-binding protein
MPSSPWQSRRSASERTTAQAWDHLTAAVTAAGDGARIAGRTAGDSAKSVSRAATRQGSRLADETGTRVGSAADEAWRRANAALDALAGRRRGVPWRWLLVAGVAGVAIGFAAAATLRTARNRSVQPAAFDGADREPAVLSPAPPPTTEQVHLDAD